MPRNANCAPGQLRILAVIAGDCNTGRHVSVAGNEGEIELHNARADISIADAITD